MAADPATATPNRPAFLTSPLANAMRLFRKPSVSLRLTLDKPTARYLIRDRDGKFSALVDGIIAETGIQSVFTGIWCGSALWKPSLVVPCSFNSCWRRWQPHSSRQRRLGSG
ncbi:hypothetical protein ACFSKW_05370 [Nonomuraea mangrovi]|uniref:Uncharacterized protein n=1 Tax=Nonomuraea mangrovi TaxID=2316207 RepID=A0ABW4SPN4_9ACTN